MMKTTTLELTPSEPFDFGTTVESHGWPQLAPFAWDAEGPALSRPEATSSGPVEVCWRGTSLGESPARVWAEVRHAADLSPADASELQARSRRVFSMDADVGEFHRRCQGQPGFEPVVERGLGRLLRSPTLFEDMVKTILTTNVNWGGTKRMVRRLVDAFGSPLPWDGDRRTFPAPEQLLAGEGRILAGDLGLGYRGPYIVELARRTAEGSLDLGRFEDGALDSETAYKELRAIKGIGPYAASSLLMLLGHFDRIPVDSWARTLIGKHFYAGQPVTDQQVADAFGEFGPFRGLAYWFYAWDR